MKKEKDKNNITLDQSSEQKGDIKVSNQILDDLSSGIYSSPASCVKELVNNSFDAKASRVTIRMKPIEDSITIIDDGMGMNALDFDENFAWISKSNKRNQGDELEGRPLIGKIGIGFIAVNEICDRFELISTKKGEDYKFTAEINFKEATRKDNSVDDGVIKAGFTLVNSPEDRNTHYTIINLYGIKKETKEILRGQQYIAEQLAKSGGKNTLKTSFANMMDVISQKTYHKSYTHSNPYVQFLVNLSAYIPVEYIEGGPIEGGKDKIIKSLVDKHNKFGFKVDLDGIYLKKPIYFPKNKKDRQAVYTFKKEIKTANGILKFKGYFFIQQGTIQPVELNGISIRVKNIPIANKYGYDNTFMGYPTYSKQIFRHWVSGEVYVEKGLEDAMNIDRQSFRETHPDYIALQNYLHKLMDDEIFPICLDMYNSGVKKRVSEKRKVVINELKHITSSGKVTIREKTTDSSISKHSSKKKADLSPITITKRNKNETVVEFNDNAFKHFKKKDREYMKNIFLIFELSLDDAKGDMQKMKTLFYKNVNTWLTQKDEKE